MTVYLDQCIDAICDIQDVGSLAVMRPINCAERESQAHFVALALESGASDRDGLSRRLLLPPIDIDAIAAWHMCLLRQSSQHRALYARLKAHILSPVKG